MIPRKWRLALLNWLGAGYMSVEVDNECYPVAVETPGSARIDVEGLNFNVMPAVGGVIVQLRQYDRKTDRNNNSTHIIPEGEDVAETIGKIVAMELWKA
jgi:hypothetical protein